LTEVQTPIAGDKVRRRGGAEALPRRDSVWDVRDRLEENFRKVMELLGEMETAQDGKMRLAAAAELRQHIALAEKTLETASRAEAVRAFQDSVLDALAEANESVRRRVVELLRTRNAHGRDDTRRVGADAGRDGDPDRAEVRGGDAG
jgi:hypothetical protein